MPSVTNHEAATKTLAKLKVTDEHAALAQLVLTLASAVDEEPGNAALARQYREAIRDLVAGTADDELDDFAKLSATLFDAKDILPT